MSEVLDFKNTQTKKRPSSVLLKAELLEAAPKSIMKPVIYDAESRPRSAYNKYSRPSSVTRNPRAFVNILFNSIKNPQSRTLGVRPMVNLSSSTKKSHTYRQRPTTGIKVAKNRLNDFKLFSSYDTFSTNTEVKVHYPRARSTGRKTIRDLEMLA